MGFSAIIDDSGASARTISNDITTLSFSTPRGVQDVTGIDKSAMERLLLLADFQFSATLVFNDAANMGFAVFKTVPSTSVARTVTLALSGQTLPNEVLFSDVAFSRPQSGEFTYSVTGALADGVAPVWA